MVSSSDSETTSCSTRTFLRVTVRDQVRPVFLSLPRCFQVRDTNTLLSRTAGPLVEEADEDAAAAPAASTTSKPSSSSSHSCCTTALSSASRSSTSCTCRSTLVRTTAALGSSTRSQVSFQRWARAVLRPMRRPKSRSASDAVPFPLPFGAPLPCPAPPGTAAPRWWTNFSVHVPSCARRSPIVSPLPGGPSETSTKSLVSETTAVVLLLYVKPSGTAGCAGRTLRNTSTGGCDRCVGGLRTGKRSGSSTWLPRED
mmetsp:Transcript_7409/g.21021  ORF Transcript_7409/g.21021 Transcript_7409/m.21021 type:complete len:256 (-) Transcript_7409:118-885(-)